MLAGEILVGDIYRFYSDRAVKIKFHVCVASGIFFFINTDQSRSNADHCFLLTKAAYPFLDYDSYLNCSLPLDYDLEEEIPGALRCAALDKATVQKVISIVSQSRVILRNQKDLIVQRLIERLSSLS